MMDPAYQIHTWMTANIFPIWIPMARFGTLSALARKIRTNQVLKNHFLFRHFAIIAGLSYHFIRGISILGEVRNVEI